ncbi:MAG: hypothetical protein JRC66_08425 [Deltaproteobacteria bacterium]|nr:hypothetical protein [Deltaproteobacteria bacterium]
MKPTTLPVIFSFTGDPGSHTGFVEKRYLRTQDIRRRSGIRTTTEYVPAEGRIRVVEPCATTRPSRNTERKGFSMIFT